MIRVLILCALIPLTLADQVYRLRVVPSANPDACDVTSDGTASDTDAKIDAASDGDVVCIPAGSFTWSSGVTMGDKKVYLQGTGISTVTCLLDATCGDSAESAEGSTEITINGNFDAIAFAPTTCTGTDIYRISGIEFVKPAGTNSRAVHMSSGSCPDRPIFRIHNIIVECETGGGSRGRGIEIGSFSYGVIDHSVFRGGTGNTFCEGVFTEWDVAGEVDGEFGSAVWALSAERGTDQAVYIEDVWVLSNGAQFHNARYGAKTVVRYSQGRNWWMETHSGCTNRGYNTIWMEVYGNTEAPATISMFALPLFWPRSNSGIAVNNAAASSHNVPFSVDHERSYRGDCQTPSFNQWCDGSQPQDDNDGSVAGYPLCWGQTGWGQPQTDVMESATFQGLFSWGNTDGGVASEMTIINSAIAPTAPATVNYTNNHIAYDREVFRASEITSGAIGSRPLTCNAGPTGRDVFRSTDEDPQGIGVLYICSATNTWTEHWRPYTYPYPLVTP